MKLHVLLLIFLLTTTGVQAQTRAVVPPRYSEKDSAAMLPKVRLIAQQWRISARNYWFQADSFKTELEEQIIANEQLRYALYGEIDLNHKKDREVKHWKAVARKRGMEPFYYTK
jgi:hypothetical protein